MEFLIKSKEGYCLWKWYIQRAVKWDWSTQRIAGETTDKDFVVADKEVLTTEPFSDEVILPEFK